MFRVIFAVVVPIVTSLLFACEGKKEMSLLLTESGRASVSEQLKLEVFTEKGGLNALFASTDASGRAVFAVRKSEILKLQLYKKSGDHWIEIADGDFLPSGLQMRVQDEYKVKIE